jgi:hypothetical protein
VQGKNTFLKKRTEAGTPHAALPSGLPTTAPVSPSSVAAPLPLEPVRPSSPSRLASSHQASGRPSPGAPAQIWPLAAGQRGLPLAGCGLLPAACRLPGPPAATGQLTRAPGAQAPSGQAFLPLPGCPHSEPDSEYSFLISDYSSCFD